VVLGFLEVSRQFGDNKHLEFEAFSRTHHVLKIAVSMEQHFLEHAVFHKTLRVPKSCSPLTVEIQSKRPVALTSPPSSAAPGRVCLKVFSRRSLRVWFQLATYGYSKQILLRL
jgi:hypothetical protein